MQNVLYGILKIHMPFMILIGISYIVFGLLFQKIRKNKFELNLLLSILSVIWVITYAVSSLKLINLFLSELDEVEFFKYIARGFAAFGFITMLASFTIPQYYIGRAIRKQGEAN